MVVQFRFAHPFDRRATERLGFATYQPANEKFQVDRLFRVSVCDFFEKFANGRFHAEFLAQFANQASLESLVRFAFAAGKFPKPAQMRPGVALGD